MVTKAPSWVDSYERKRKYGRLTAAGRVCAAWATLEEHDKVLDMVCGEGALLQRLDTQYRLQLCGMCESSEQAKAVRGTLTEADVIPGRMDDIPWRDNTFHAVFLPVSLSAPAEQQALREAFRVLRAGGQLLASVSMLPVRGNDRMNYRGVMRAMQEAGFVNVSCRTSGLQGVAIGWKGPNTSCLLPRY